MASANPGISSTNLFRRLAWQSSIPLEIRLAEGEPGAGSDYDRYYVSDHVCPSRETQLKMLPPLDARSETHLPSLTYPRDSRELRRDCSQ